MPANIDQFITVDEAGDDTLWNIELRIDFNSPEKERLMVSQLARQLNREAIVTYHYLLGGKITKNYAYDYICAPWVSHMDKIYKKKFLTLTIPQELEKKLNYIEILISKILEENLISKKKYHELIEKIKAMACIPRQNIEYPNDEVSGVDASQLGLTALIENFLEKTELPNRHSLVAELIVDRNKHLKAIAMINPQNLRLYAEKNGIAKSHALAYHEACLHEIEDKLGLNEQLKKFKKVVSMMQHQKPKNFFANHRDGLFSSKKQALMYYTACIEELESVKGNLVRKMK